MKIDLEKTFTIGGIVAAIIGAGCEVAKGFVKLRKETKNPEITGPTDDKEDK